MDHENVRGGLGGIYGLGQLIHTRWAPLEADFARYYQIDFRQAVFGPEAVGARRLIALIRGLSADSALARAGPLQPQPVSPRRQRMSSSPEQIRRAGGRFIHAPKGE